jgi:hypothetical protein
MPVGLAACIVACKMHGEDSFRILIIDAIIIWHSLFF